MSCTLERPSHSMAAREREFYRYFQPEDTTPINFDGPQSRKTSTDPVLTAFAQLGCLRLNAKCSVISLCASTAEYVIAEAGPSLSLQKDVDETNQLWHGIGAIPHKEGEEGLIKQLFGDGEDIFIVNDLTQQDPFKDWHLVREEPHARFLAAVPLRTPSKIVIGAYLIFDTEVRYGLSIEDQHVLSDMAVTVIDYLQVGLIKRKQQRAETMIKAMGLFVEGKSSLREWWLAYGHKSSQGHRKRTPKSVSLDELADQEFGVQDGIDTFSTARFQPQRPSMSRATSSTAPSAAGTDEADDARPSTHREQSTVDSTTESSTYLETSVSSAFPHGRQASVTTVGTHSVTFDLPEQTTAEGPVDLQDAVVSRDTRDVFARASNLIRQACGVEGVIYYDASVGSFGGSANDSVMSEKAPGEFKMDKSSSDSEVIDKHSTLDGAIGHVPVSGINSGSETESTKEKCCNVLGFSTRKKASLGGHSVLDEHRKLPESALRRMMKKYPHGKVFNFDENGQMSSDSESLSSSVEDANSPLRETPSEPKQRTKRRSRVAETEVILKIFPGARSVFFFPLWDSNRDRWYSGSFVWSTSPSRVLCPFEDLVYLASFSNSIMAEVARISQQVLAQMKTDFIASISHELRSPLHGVLASVEFLQETTLDEMQLEMVNNINASGKVLLDTINHVLDFSKVNRKANNNSRFSKRNSKRSKKMKRGEKAADDAQDICVLSEEVIESVYAGQRVKRPKTGSRADRDVALSPVENPVTIIVDVAWRPNWAFDIDPGAWRRILMNLFSNAMKYTSSGFIKISLHIEEDGTSKGKLWGRTLVLKLNDSGKGISQEFLKHQLFRPFRQEDSLATGTGLGLSIIRHIIQDLGGRINISSELGSGTEAIVRIPLPLQSNTPPVLDTGNIASVKELTKGFTYSLEGFERYPDISEEPTGILPSDVEAAMHLKASTNAVLQDWFDMKHHDNTNNLEDQNLVKLVVVMEAGLTKTSLQDVLQPYCQRTSISSKKPIAIVLCSSYQPTSRVEHDQYFDIFYLQQPYGPHKFANLLSKILSSTSECQHSSTATQVVPSDPNSQRPSSMRGTSQHDITTPTASTSLLSAIKNAAPSDGTEKPTGLWSKDTAVQPAGLWSQKTNENQPIKVSGSLDSTTPVFISPSDGLRILLVEDNEINLKLLVAYMRKLKLDHATASNGLEALDSYKEQAGKYDVIFMDISMPIMDGIESSRHIRKYEQDNFLPPVALIALTGAANPRARQEAFSSGVDVYLTKPVTMKSLKVMLEDIKREGRKVLHTFGDERA